MSTQYTLSDMPHLASTSSVTPHMDGFLHWTYDGKRFLFFLSPDCVYEIPCETSCGVPCDSLDVACGPSYDTASNISNTPFNASSDTSFDTSSDASSDTDSDSNSSLNNDSEMVEPETVVHASCPIVSVRPRVPIKGFAVRTRPGSFVAQAGVSPAKFAAQPQIPLGSFACPPGGLAAQSSYPVSSSVSLGYSDAGVGIQTDFSGFAGSSGVSLGCSAVDASIYSSQPVAQPTAFDMLQSEQMVQDVFQQFQEELSNTMQQMPVDMLQSIQPQAPVDLNSMQQVQTETSTGIGSCYQDTSVDVCLLAACILEELRSTTPGTALFHNLLSSFPPDLQLALSNSTLDPSVFEQLVQFLERKSTDFTVPQASFISGPMFHCVRCHQNYQMSENRPTECRLYVHQGLTAVPIWGSWMLCRSDGLLLDPATDSVELRFKGWHTPYVQHLPPACGAMSCARLQCPSAFGVNTGGLV
ncbi:hypothetical protein BKA93DRAFT_827971 [Sparassis latifolia]